MAAVPRYRPFQFAGFAGAVLLAASAYLGGAQPTLIRRQNVVTIWRGEHGPLIYLCWLAGTALMVWAWLALRDRVPSVRWALATTGLWLIPLLAAPPLGSRDVYAYACQGASYAAGIDPYSNGVEALPCPWLESVSPVWRDTPAPYGPLFLMIAGAVVGLTGSLTGAIVVFRLVAVLGVALAAVALPILAGRVGVRPERAVWLALACPLVGVHLISGAHNDALMIGLLVAGIAVIAARRGRAGALAAGGVLLGLAVAVKVTAAVVVPFAVLAGNVGPYRVRELVRTGAWVAGGLLAAVASVMLASGLAFGWVGGLTSSGLSVQWTSPTTAVGLFVGYVGRLFGAHVNAVPVTRTLGVIALAPLLFYLWWRVWRRGVGTEPDPCPPLHGAGLALASTVVLAPVFHPWYATWPLALLACTARRTAWFVVPCAVACFLVLPNGYGLALATRFPGTLAMTGLVVWLVVWAVRRSRSADGFRIGARDRSPPVRS
jgi:alpha-1,6-mannosyltransferase